MRIGKLEISYGEAEGSKPEVGSRKAEVKTDLTGVFAVSDQEPWWLAVDQLLDTLEWETIDATRNNVSNTNLLINAVGAGEGVAMVRQRLWETRREALQKSKELQGLR